MIEYYLLICEIICNISLIGGVIVIKTILTIVFVIIGLVLTVIVLMQESKSSGLTGAISGAADTYWGNNKGRSMEGALEKATKILAVLFLVLAVVLNCKYL